MIRNDIGSKPSGQPRLRDRIVDWLGAQGPSFLTLYMCAAVALVAFAADATR